MTGRITEPVEPVEPLEPAEPAEPAVDAAADAVVDADRLAAVAGLHVLGGRDEVLDALARRAAEATGAGTALVNLVLDTAQQVAGGHGVTGLLAEAGGVPLEWSFCAALVRGADELVVPDAARDPRYADNPLVWLEGVRAYAGVPLALADGRVVGSCCVADAEPRAFTPGDLAALRAVAAEAAAHLERRGR